MTAPEVVDAEPDGRDAPQVPSTGPRPWLRACVAVAAYLGCARLLLAPVTSTPVLADDFANPWVQTDAAGVGLGDALGYGWDGATQGASFRVLGTLTGSTFNWAWTAVSARTGIPLSTLYAVTRYVVLVAAAAAAAWVWATTSRRFGRGRPWRVTMVPVSVALFATLQVHALWSNDPVANYPLAGYGGATFGLLTIALAVDAAGNPTVRAFGAAALAALAAVLYYEANVGAVLGAGIILAVATWRRRDLRAATRRSLIGCLAVVGPPAVLLLYGRTVTGGNAATYSGTTIQLSGGPRAFLIGAAGSLPGSAWPLSHRMLDGDVGFVLLPLALVAAVTLVLWWWWRVRGASDHDLRDTDAVDRLGVASVVVALVVFASVVLAIQAITQKIQVEAPEVGYVYTAYAFSSVVVALGLAVVVVHVLRSGRRAVRIAVALVVVVFAAGQATINWRLSERLNVAYASNRRLLAAFDEDASPPMRCHALVAWRAAGWPRYYEDGVTEGMQDAYEHYFDEPFCPGLGGDDA